MKNNKIAVLGFFMIIIISGAIFQLYVNNDKQNEQPTITDNTIQVENYIKENISELSPEKEVLGGKFFVTKLDFPGNNQVNIEYEDGHNLFEARAVYSYEGDQVVINDFSVASINGSSCEDSICYDPNGTVDVSKEELPDAPQEKLGAVDCLPEQRDVDACIEIYQPVCGQMQVECITTPCDPVKQTFSNSCKACANERVFSYTVGDCDESDEVKR